jgi:undecaprenyl-diphosphatase
LDAIEAALLGVVQGLTEFFPVSSSGHLALVQTLFGTRMSGGLVFEVAVHVATLVAIAAYYHGRIAELVVGVFRRDREALEYVAKLALATVPAVVVGLGAKDWIESQFSNPTVVAVALLTTGAVVFTTRWTAGRAFASRPGWGVALAIGLAQACAILPGISRSGATVATALALGVAPLAAAEFSFLLGIIAISGAAVLMLPELSQVDAGGLVSIGLGSATALASGMVAIWLFVQMLDRRVFHLWAGYCWVVGGAFLVWSLA